MNKKIEKIDEKHVRNYLREKNRKNNNNDKNESIKQEKQTNLRRKLSEEEIRFENNIKNKNNNSTDMEKEVENKVEDSGIHLSEGFVYIYIASDNEIVKEAFAEYLKEYNPNIRGKYVIEYKYGHLMFLLF